MFAPVEKDLVDRLVILDALQESTTMPFIPQPHLGQLAKEPVFVDINQLPELERPPEVAPAPEFGPPSQLTGA